MSLKRTDTDIRPKINLKFSTKGIIFICFLLKSVLKFFTYSVQSIMPLTIMCIMPLTAMCLSFIGKHLH